MGGWTRNNWCKDDVLAQDNLCLSKFLFARARKVLCSYFRMNKWNAQSFPKVIHQGRAPTFEWRGAHKHGPNSINHRKPPSLHPSAYMMSMANSSTDMVVCMCLYNDKAH